ncbi:MAG: hypothetical protein KGZ39_05935 [Simkania sp.]|nr:hypothetical protein [Simkania sp.]
MRMELIHPMLVHFPLALLFVGVCLKTLSFPLRASRSYRYLRVTSWILLALGVCFAWLAILAGETAAAVVQTTLREPTILQDHSLVAYTTAYLFTIALLLDWVKTWGIQRFFSPRFATALTVVDSFIFLAAFIILIITAFLGGSLVYDQGAAVEKSAPSSEHAPQGTPQKKP